MDVGLDWRFVTSWHIRSCRRRVDLVPPLVEICHAVCNDTGGLHSGGYDFLNTAVENHLVGAWGLKHDDDGALRAEGLCAQCTATSMQAILVEAHDHLHGGTWLVRDAR